MAVSNGLFSSESVSEGHPDKLADRISDAILDKFLLHDPTARVACETLLADQCVVVAGEFKTRSPQTFRDVRESTVGVVATVLRDAGYRESDTGIDPDHCEVQVRFNSQSNDISQGVDRSDGELGAGDQGLMFGYACDETPELMPAPITFAHRLMRRHAELRRMGALPWLGPDAKSQVTFRYEDGRPVAVEAVVLSTQHAEDIDTVALRAAVSRHIIDPIVPKNLRAAGYRELINPTGRFVIGGPKGDTGLTGRKIIVDTYGGAAPHGGGAFSGKDPSKVDRSAAYMARFLAKQVVARGWANRVLVQLAYAIGIADPVSFAVEGEGVTASRSAEIVDALRREFDLTPAGIVRYLDLQRPIYYPTAAYGHFGRDDLDLPWEAVHPAPAIRSSLDAGGTGTNDAPCAGTTRAESGAHKSRRTNENEHIIEGVKCFFRNIVGSGITRVTINGKDSFGFDPESNSLVPPINSRQLDRLSERQMNALRQALIEHSQRRRQFFASLRRNDPKPPSDSH